MFRKPSTTGSFGVRRSCSTILQTVIWRKTHASPKSTSIRSAIKRGYTETDRKSLHLMNRSGGSHAAERLHLGIAGVFARTLVASRMVENRGHPDRDRHASDLCYSCRT